MKRKKQIITTFISVALVIAVTVAAFYFKKNADYTNRDRLIIFAYQTNISGSDGENWASALKTRFTDMSDFEVSTFSLMETGNSQITITEENGWSQIVTRLAAKQGDILFVNNEIFYSTLLKGGYLVELENEGERCVKDKDGVTYGLDITDLYFEGLVNTGTSEYVGKMQPLPVKSAEDEEYIYEGEGYSPRVIAVIYKGSTHIEAARSVLNTLFNEALSK